MQPEPLLVLGQAGDELAMPRALMGSYAAGNVNVLADPSGYSPGFVVMACAAAAASATPPEAAVGGAVVVASAAALYVHEWASPGGTRYAYEGYVEAARWAAGDATIVLAVERGDQGAAVLQTEGGEGNPGAGASQGGGTVEEVLEGVAPGGKTRGPTTPCRKPGTFDFATADFDSLCPADLKSIGGGGRAGTLPDGRKLVVRPVAERTSKDRQR